MGELHPVHQGPKEGAKGQQRGQTKESKVEAIGTIEEAATCRTVELRGGRGFGAFGFRHDRNSQTPKKKPNVPIPRSRLEPLKDAPRPAQSGMDMNGQRAGASAEDRCKAEACKQCKTKGTCRALLLWGRMGWGALKLRGVVAV